MCPSRTKNVKVVIVDLFCDKWKLVECRFHKFVRRRTDCVRVDVGQIKSCEGGCAELQHIVIAVQRVL